MRIISSVDGGVRARLRAPAERRGRAWCPSSTPCNASNVGRVKQSAAFTCGVLTGDARDLRLATIAMPNIRIDVSGRGHGSMLRFCCRVLAAHRFAVFAAAASAERRVALVHRRRRLRDDPAARERRQRRRGDRGRRWRGSASRCSSRPTATSGACAARSTIFARTRDGADVALVFFAGHGIEIAGDNRLLPVDADASSLEALKATTLPLEEVRETVAAIAKVGLIMLDACRNDPFAALAATDRPRRGGADGKPRRSSRGSVASAGPKTSCSPSRRRPARPRPTAPTAIRPSPRRWRNISAPTGSKSARC